MLKVEFLQELLFISMVLSTITCTVIQKTKSLFRSSKYLALYSLFVNLLFSIIFCISFTTVDIVSSIWVGFFSFLGADSIYKALEGKIASHQDIRINKK